MKRTQLAAAVLLATGSVSAFAATYSVTPLPLQDTARNNFARSIDNSGKMFYFKSYRKSTFISFESIPNNVILPNLKLLEQIITELLTIKDSYYLVKMYGVAMLDDDLYHPKWRKTIAPRISFCEGDGLFY